MKVLKLLLAHVNMWLLICALTTAIAILELPSNLRLVALEDELPSSDRSNPEYPEPPLPSWLCSTLDTVIDCCEMNYTAMISASPVRINSCRSNQPTTIVI